MPSRRTYDKRIVRGVCDLEPYESCSFPLIFFLFYLEYLRLAGRASAFTSFFSLIVKILREPVGNTSSQGTGTFHLQTADTLIRPEECKPVFCLKILFDQVQGPDA